MQEFLGTGNDEYINKTVKWFGSDTEEKYNKNKMKLVKRGINVDDISYSFNSNGFRCSEFTSDPGIAFLGCSNTVGVGVRKQDTFSFQISNQLKLQELNLSVGGSSNDTAFRLAHYWFEKLRPVVAVWLLTYDDRFELINKKRSIRIKSTDRIYNDDLYKVWITNIENQYLQKTRNIFGVKHICDTYNIPLIVMDIDNVDFQDYARDLSHPGRNTHSYIVDTVMSNTDIFKDRIGK